MFKPLSSILFATNLSENCRPAFECAASLATRYQANLVLLHVIEKMPDYIEGRLRGLLGEKQWREMGASHESNARETLIGKKSDSKLVREALEQFCADAGIDDDACGYSSREVLVTDGDIVDEIIDKSKAHNCDLIVLGARQGLLSKETAIGPHIKGVLRRSRIPVMVVPPAPL